MLRRGQGLYQFISYFFLVAFGLRQTRQIPLNSSCETAACAARHESRRAARSQDASCRRGDRRRRQATQHAATLAARRAAAAAAGVADDAIALTFSLELSRAATDKAVAVAAAADSASCDAVQQSSSEASTGLPN